MAWISKEEFYNPCKSLLNIKCLSSSMFFSTVFDVNTNKLFDPCDSRLLVLSSFRTPNYVVKVILVCLARWVMRLDMLVSGEGTIEGHTQPATHWLSGFTGLGGYEHCPVGALRHNRLKPKPDITLTFLLLQGGLQPNIVIGYLSIITSCFTSSALLWNSGLLSTLCIQLTTKVVHIHR